MRYNYLCKLCSTGKEALVFEVAHGMNETPKVPCPKCKKTNTEKTFIGVDVIFYVRGNGWLDVKGRRRDMHLYKLMNDDPYKSIRPPGEKEDLANKLRKGGKFNSNPNKPLFMSGNGRKKSK